MARFIQENYMEKISLADIAAAGAVGQSKCCKLFARFFFQSPTMYLTQHRLSKSMELLLNTDLPIQHIACSCGYSGNYAFTKAFKKITGLSPTLYRKEKKGEKGGLSRQDPHKDEKLYFTELR